MENEALYVGIVVFFAALAVHALYWMARADKVIRDLVQGLATYLELSTSVIADQRARITALEAEIERLRDRNVIQLRREPRT